MCKVKEHNNDNNAPPSNQRSPSATTADQYSLVWRIWQEVQAQGRTSVPTMLGMLLYKVPWLLSLRFVGNIGSEELAAAALATTLCNVTGMSLSVGLSSAMTTLTGQARGDLMAQPNSSSARPNSCISDDISDPSSQLETDSFLLSNPYTTTSSGSNHHHNHTQPRERMPNLTIVYLYRGIFIQLLFVIPVGIWWLIGIKPTLLKLGQGEVLAVMTEQYLRILTPGLWSYSVNWTLTTWLQTIDMADVPAYAAAMGLILHIPLNWLFIYELGWGYLGCAAATVCFQLLQPVGMLYYLLGTSHGRTRALEHTGATTTAIMGRRTRHPLSSSSSSSSSSFREELQLAVCSIAGIGQYLGLALPGIVIISEWWASEITIFLGGHLSPSPALALDGMTIYQSINTFCFMFPVGSSVAGSARVGTFLGLGDARRAAFAGNVCVVTAMTLSTLVASILLFTPHTFLPSLFSPDEDVIEGASRTIPLLAVYVFADGVQVAMNGIIKGCGRQCVTMPIVVIAYWAVGVPLAYYFAFVRNDAIMCNDDFFCGIVGLVAGMTTGTWLHMLLLAFVVYGTTNWTIEEERANARMELEKVGSPSSLKAPVAATSAAATGPDAEVRGVEMMSI